MGAHNKQLGKAGEDAAAAYLTENGYTLLERNYRTAYGELDIVARKGDTLCFGEVKTRRTDAYGLPRLAVTETKQRHLAAAALLYLQEHPFAGSISFDILEVTPAGVTHLADAFRPEEGF